MEQQNHINLLGKTPIFSAFERISQISLLEFVQVSKCPKNAPLLRERNSVKREIVHVESLKFILRERSAATFGSQLNESSSSCRKDFWKTLQEAIAENPKFNSTSLKSKKFITSLLVEVYWEFRFVSKGISNALLQEDTFIISDEILQEKTFSSSGNFMLAFLNLQAELRSMNLNRSFTNALCTMERCIEIASIVLSLENESSLSKEDFSILVQDTDFLFYSSYFESKSSSKVSWNLQMKKLKKSFIRLLNSNTIEDDSSFRNPIHQAIIVSPLMEWFFTLENNHSKEELQSMNAEQWISLFRDIGQVEQFDERIGWFCSFDGVIRFKYDLQEMHLIWPSVWKAALKQQQITYLTLGQTGTLIFGNRKTKKIRR